MTPRKHPPLLFRGAFSERVYIVTRYKRDDEGRVHVHEKYDVTDQFNGWLR